MAERQLTHHVNVQKPGTDKVETFEPGETLPAWARDVLIESDHPAYPVRGRKSEALVASWTASKQAAEAAAAAAADDTED